MVWLTRIHSQDVHDGTYCESVGVGVNDVSSCEAQNDCVLMLALLRDRSYETIF